MNVGFLVCCGVGMEMGFGFCVCADFGWRYEMGSSGEVPRESW